MDALSISVLGDGFCACTNLNQYIIANVLSDNRSRKRLVALSITHKLGSEDEAELDICEACETSPYDGVSRRRVFWACQVAP
jgi:hypothetical protein